MVSSSDLEAGKDVSPARSFKWVAVIGLLVFTSLVSMLALQHSMTADAGVVHAPSHGAKVDQESLVQVHAPEAKDAATTAPSTMAPTTMAPTTTAAPTPAPTPSPSKECVKMSLSHLVYEYKVEGQCLSKDERKEIIQNLVFTLVDALEAHGIEYWVDSGTLLGVFRDKGMLEHDVDADFGLTADGFTKLKATNITLPDPAHYELFVNDSPYFRKGPYEYLPGRYVDKTNGFYVDMFEFHPSFNTTKAALNWSEPETKHFVEFDAENATSITAAGATIGVVPKKGVHIKVEMTEVIEMLAPVKSQCWWCSKCIDTNYFIIPKDWVFPLKRCEFDGKQVWCPNDPVQYLTMLYGDNFRTPWVWNE